MSTLNQASPTNGQVNGAIPSICQNPAAAGSSSTAEVVPISMESPPAPVVDNELNAATPSPAPVVRLPIHIRLRNFCLRIFYFISFYNIFLKSTMSELFRRHKRFRMELNTNLMPGDVIVITGAYSGIGTWVLRKLLKRDLHVIIGTRDLATTETLVGTLRREEPLGRIEALELDLASFPSVRAFANVIRQRRIPIHGLINYAGIMASEYRLTEDQQETTFQVNYLGHFLLTLLLLPQLIMAGEEGKRSRIVNVSSTHHFGGKLYFEDLQCRNFFSKYKAYMDSKLAQITFANFLNRKFHPDILSECPSYVNVYSVHPGFVLTDLYEGVSFVQRFRWIWRCIMKTPKQGADCIAFAAMYRRLENQSGIFLANSRKCLSHPDTMDRAVQHRLWQASLRSVGYDDESEFAWFLTLPEPEPEAPPTVAALVADMVLHGNKFEAKLAKRSKTRNLPLIKQVQPPPGPPSLSRDRLTAPPPLPPRPNILTLKTGEPQEQAEVEDTSERTENPKEETDKIFLAKKWVAEKSILEGKENEEKTVLEKQVDEDKPVEENVENPVMPKPEVAEVSAMVKPEETEKPTLEDEEKAVHENSEEAKKSVLEEVQVVGKYVEKLEDAEKPVLEEQADEREDEEKRAIDKPEVVEKPVEKLEDAVKPVAEKLDVVVEMEEKQLAVAEKPAEEVIEVEPETKE